MQQVLGTNILKQNSSQEQHTLVYIWETGSDAFWQMLN